MLNHWQFRPARVIDRKTIENFFKACIGAE